MGTHVLASRGGEGDGGEMSIDLWTILILLLIVIAVMWIWRHR
jgi:hypothetical protein